MKRALLWFRRDLRIADNPAFSAAAHAKCLLPLYILDETAGGASRWWLHHSLASLRRSLAKRGFGLVLKRGDPAEILPRLVQEHSLDAVFWNRLYEPARAQEDAALEASLSKHCAVRTHNGTLLLEPSQVATGQGAPYKVFTAYWRECRRLLHRQPPNLAAAVAPAKPVAGVRSERLDDWRLLPRNPDWAVRFRESGRAGEPAAQARWQAFVEGGMAGYADGRDRPAAAATSRLSAHLHFGEISPAAIWRDAVRAADVYPHRAADIEKFLSELGWREFSHYLLHHFPHTIEAPFQRRFAAFPWRRDAAALRRWQRGMTGYPLVDAGMRELWATGYMHNRVRMVCASFLTKHLLLHWRDGADWFMDTLVDADLANNTAGWQWVAGCGADAAPYFRIFNPSLQAEKFDPHGEYVRRWVPELSSGAYPPPMVDHRMARTRALQAYRSMRGGSVRR